MTAASSVTSSLTPTALSLPNLLAIAATRSSSACLVDIGQHDAGAFVEQSQRRRAADAAGAAGDIGDAAGERLRLGHALQLGLFEQPIFDVERFLLGQADIGADARGAAHDVDRVDVEFRGDARGRLVLGEGEHADAGHEIDHRVGIAHRRRVGVLAALVIAGVVGAIGGELSSSAAATASRLSAAGS